MKHGSTPWFLRQDNSIRSTEYKGKPCDRVLGYVDSFSSEDAKFIVRACNANDELLDALKKAADIIMEQNNGNCPVIVLDAIAKAEAE